MPEQITEGTPVTATVTKNITKVWSVPCSKSTKEFILNEALRTNLSQKDLLDMAIKLLKEANIPAALPIKL